MDRITYEAQQALKSYDSAERAARRARARFDTALEAWGSSRPGTVSAPALRDTEATLRLALRLVGELPEVDTPPADSVG